MAGKYETAVLQDLMELSQLGELMRAEGVRSYLEIGCKHGGSLWHIAKYLPEGSRIVAVDLPHGDTSFKESEPHLRECVARLRDMGYLTHLFIGDSTNPEIISAVRQLAPFDAIFIDANHTEPYVRADWKNYGSMGRIVAFHDIGYRVGVNRAPSKKFPIQVPAVWNELRQGYRHREFLLHHTKQDNGIGVLWRDEPVQ